MSLLAQLSAELEALVARAAPAVVGIEHARGQGSGVVLAGDGYVVTNAHVVGAGPRSLRVRLHGGEVAPASVVGTDARTDLAVVRAEAARLPSLALADDGRPRVGQLVVAIGNPLRFDGSVTVGVVSALHRALPGRDGPLEALVQTDAAVNPGNSGGPLLNASGEVIGVTPMGVGFAVPVNAAKRLLD